MLILPLPGPVVAAPVEVGYRDFSYGSGVSAPTGQKPQSKLWFNDGRWWGALYSTAAGAFTIHELNWATQEWSDTAVEVDPRSSARLDVLWDGASLYTASAGTGSGTGDSAQIRRFSYSTGGGYALDAGFPVSIVDGGMEAGVFDKDTTGTLWFTFTRANAAYVTHTTSDDATWAAPFVLPFPGATTLADDDISSVVAYDGNVGVMWSNQNDSTMYFATHVDGAIPTQWTVNPAVQLPEYADDHMNLKSLQADADGRVYAATKTSLNAGSAPLMLLLVLDANGNWQRHTVATVADDHTRPLVLIDQENRQLYWFAASPCCSGGTIYYKQTSLDAINFAPGLGTPFIQSSSDVNVNNIASTKQALDSSTGLVAIAGDDHTRFYLHNAFDLGSSGGPPQTTITSGPSGDVVDTTAAFTFVASTPGSTFECSLDGAAPAPCSSPAAYAGLALGAHTFDVLARDPAGVPDPTPAHADWTIVSSGEVVIELDLAVTSGTDDAEQWQDGTINLTSSDLELVDDSGRGNQTIGIRFNGLNVPAGATITDAWLQFQVDEASSGTVSLAIQAEDTDSAGGFTTAVGEIGARARTAATVAWSPPGWPTVGSAGLDQRTPSLAALVQAVVGRSGWSPGNSIAFIITGSGTRWAESYDGDAAGAPKLHVAYATTPPEPPTISGVAPTSGPPGTGVTIDGSRLFGATSVTFNGVVAPFSVVSDAQLTATVPGAATSGPVSVTTSGGTVEGPAFTVTEPPPTGAIRVPNDQPTIQAAIDVAQDGDVILIAPGTYHESVLISGKNLTLASQFYETADPALIEATVIDTDGTADAITIRGTSGAGSSIVGLKLVKASALILDGIRVEGSARILDTHIVGFDDGVDLDPTGGALAACECRRNLIELGTDDGFDLDGATGGIYEQNVLQNNVEDGIEVRLSDEAAEIPITFRDNEFRGNGQDGIQIIDLIGASNRVFTIERNRFIDNGRAAIGLMDNGQSGEDYRAASLPDRIALFNNTFSGNNHGVSGGDNVIGLNNLFVNSTGIGVKGVDGSSLLAYNLFWNNGTDDAASNLDMSSSQFSDPQLAGDHSLTSGSPAIDAGVATYTFGGELVLDLQPGSYNGSAPDLGAFESSGGGPGGPAAPTIALPVDGATVTTRTFTVRGSAPTGTVVRLLADGSERASTVVANDGSWATVVNGLADGPHALTAVTIDALGAESLPSAQTSISVALVTSDPVVAAAGDIACDHVGSTECRQMATSDLLLERNYDAVLTLGDHQYECGSPTEFALGYDPSWGRVKPITRPAVGNHEYFTDRGVDCDPTGTATGYFDYFGAAAGTQGAGWYSYDLGDWHLVALNSNCSDVGGCDAGSPQEQWLQADLAASTASCTLAYWHHPRWSSGSAHGSDPVTQALVDALYAHGAELILAGHDHHYERFGPQAPDGSVDLAHGIRAFVAGTGGKALVPLGTTAPNSELRADTAFGVLELTLGSGSYDWAFVTEAGATTDAGTGGCHDAPGAADTTPPQTTVISGPSDPSTSANATFDVISSETGSTFECSMDGAPFTACTPPASYSGLAEGAHTFAARATDAASNTDPTPASWTWTVDTVAPSLIAAMPSDGATDVAIGALVTATFDEPMDPASISTSTFRLTQGGAPVGASVAYEPATKVATLTPDAPLGISVAYVVTLDGVADLAGNAMAIATWSFTTEADTTPPQTTITSGPGDPSSSPDATFAFTSSEVGSTFACSLDSAAFTACSSPIMYTALADGPHEFAVRASDSSANMDPTPATWSWTIDTTVPPSPTTVTFTPNADAHVREASPNSNYGSSSTLITDGVDGGGAAEATVRFGVSGVGGPVQQAQLRIWVTNKTNNGPAIYRSDAAWNEDLVTWASRPARVGGAVASSGSIATGWYEFDVTSAVSGDGSYSFTLVPTSSDGLDFSSREGSVRPQLVVTFLGDDTTPPATSITSGPSGASGSSSATFTFISSELGSTFSCSLDAESFTPCTSPQQYTGLANGDHDFAVRATDVSGNTDPTPATAAWTIVTATTDTFLAEADSTVDERRSTSNFGSATTLESDGDSGRAKQAFLRFDASGISAVIVSAKLRVWVTNATSNGPQVFLADSAWSENTVTWATRPSLLSGQIDDAGTVSAGAWYEFDVTAAVSGAGLYSFALVSTSTDALKFASRETTTPPELLVAYGT